jgi:hypothetical protein
LGGSVQTELVSFPSSPSYFETQREMLSVSQNKKEKKEKKLTRSAQNHPIYKDESAIAMRKGFDGGQTITFLF